MILWTLAVLWVARSVQEALGLILLIGGLLGPAWVALVFVGARQSVRVTEEGLEVLSSFGAQAGYVGWGESRLFAIVPPGRRGSPPVTYELASPTLAVRWVRARRQMPVRPWHLEHATRPALPLDEYDRQMARVLSVVASRTGLPLADVRET